MQRGHLGAYGAATKVKLVNNSPGRTAAVAGTAQAMALGLKAGVDKKLLIKAIAERQRRLDRVHDPRTPGWQIAGFMHIHGSRLPGSRTISTRPKTWPPMPESGRTCSTA